MESKDARLTGYPNKLVLEKIDSGWKKKKKEEEKQEVYYEFNENNIGHVMKLWLSYLWAKSTRHQRQGDVVVRAL